MRYGVRAIISGYLRVRLEGVEHLPAGVYLVCFNHPNWADPFLFMGYWPRPRRLYILGPKEEDMSAGFRNRLIGWSDRGVPFKPGKNDLLATTRRVLAVLKAGNVLAIAGEGRLSERADEVLRLNDGPAYYALRARVPIVPVAIVGTRWLHFGKVVRIVIGRPIAVDGRAARGSVDALTATVHGELQRLVGGRPPEPVPGPFGRWLTELFNDRS